MLAPSIVPIIVAFFVLLGVFRLLELTRPAERRLPLLRLGLFTDAAYWLINPFVNHYVGGFAIVLLLVPVALAVHGHVDKDALLAGYGPLSRLPLAVQGAMMFVLADFMSYWLHRWFHGRRLWRFHAVHHSSTELDWLSAARAHPVNEALSRAAILLPVVAAGFSLKAAVWIGSVFVLYSLPLHANVDWGYGPLRKVLASPLFHRWHHCDEPDVPALCNLAGVFPVWDILFGTYFMPEGRVPRHFGTSTPVPEGVVGQLAFPFRRRSSQTSQRVS